MSKWTCLVICALLIFSCPGYGQKAEIYGKWYFDRFGGPHGEISKDAEAVKANKQNEGLSLTFTKDNKVIMQRKTGDAMTVPFKLLADKKEITLGRDTMRIMLLTSAILELYLVSEDRPAMFLKRSKDGKTAMSAQ